MNTSSLISKDPETDLLSLISCPNGRSKHKIWEQYDSMVQLHTIEGPGAPAAVGGLPHSLEVLRFFLSDDAALPGTHGGGWVRHG